MIDDADARTIRGGREGGKRFARDLVWQHGADNRERERSGESAPDEQGEFRGQFDSPEHRGHRAVEVGQIGEVLSGNPEIEAREVQPLATDDRGDIAACGAVELARADAGGSCAGLHGGEAGSACPGDLLAQRRAGGAGRCEAVQRETERRRSELG